MINDVLFNIISLQFFHHHLQRLIHPHPALDDLTIREWNILTSTVEETIDLNHVQRSITTGI